MTGSGLVAFLAVLGFLVALLLWLCFGIRRLLAEERCELALERLERKLERERLLAEAREERHELHGMIVAYDPNVYRREEEPPAPAGKPPASQGAGKVSADEPAYSAVELAEANIRENEDGGYIDMTTGALFETAEDIQEWRAELRKKGLPTNIHPAIVQEAGLEMGVESARKSNGPQEGSRK